MLAGVGRLVRVRIAVSPSTGQIVEVLAQQNCHRLPTMDRTIRRLHTCHRIEILTGAVLEDRIGV